MDITANHWILVWIALAVILMPVQFFIAAPYGRHSSVKWGPEINSKAGWVLMELVALMAFVLSFVTGTGVSTVTLIIAGLFALHYLHRSVIYPMMTRTGSKKMPLLIVLFAVLFNIVNGHINGDYLGENHHLYGPEYLKDPRFLIGIAVFAIGALINISSDYYLISLRKNGEEGTYHIPRGRFFRWVSCPNHMGEIIEWAGFAIMCWHLPAVAFLAWTVSNLVPRAWHHHQWYLKRFEDYPQERKAVIPGVL